MATQLETGSVVVGVDGTESALRAVRWASAQAQHRGVGLRLVHAFELPGRTTGEVGEERHIRELLHAQGERWLVGSRAVALETAPDLTVEVVGEDASAAELLIEESATASLVVLGTRGLGGFTGLLMGSTAIAVAGHARCPMVIVCGSGDLPAHGPVVVGVDRSTTSDEAVAFAFRFASECGADLVAVHSRTEPVPMDAATTMLATRLAQWQAEYPDVRVTRLVGDDKPAHALLAQAAGAQLVVVGSRGRGGFRGLVLGSTSQHVLHHSPCPVAVVRPATR